MSAIHSIRTSPISQVEIEERIIKLLDDLEYHTEAFESLAEDGARKESRLKGEWAKVQYVNERLGQITNLLIWILTTSAPRHWSRPSEKNFSL
jgi:hypothetical protein